MANRKFKNMPSQNVQMAEIMVSQWTDDRLKKAQAIELIRAYGINPSEAEGILDRELRKRKWK